MQHFPHRIAFDPFTLFPIGQDVPFAPFFDLLLGSFIWVIGLGSPTQHTIEIVGAYFPAILGAVVTVPVYFVGRELFNRNVGLLSAALIAILPGQYFFRSLLGFTDHHVAEVLFSTTAALFLILALKNAKRRGTSFSHIRSREWGNLKKPLIYALLTGLAVGIYLTSWIGGVLFVSIIFAYIVIQYIIDHLRGESTDYLCIIGVPMFLIALLIVIPFLGFITQGDIIIASLLISILTLLLLRGVSWLLSYRDIKRLYYPVALAILGVLGIALLYVIDPSLYHNMVGKFQQVFFPSGTAQTIGEVQSLLSLTGFLQAVAFFTTSAFISLIALGFLIYAWIKKRSVQRIEVFFIVWTLIMMLALLGQNRFAYYFAVNIALLSGFLCWKILELSWGYLAEILPEPEVGRAEEKQAVPQRAEGANTVLQRAVGIAVASYHFLIYNPKWIGARGMQTGELTASENGEALRKPIKSRLRVWQGMAGVSIIVFLIAFIPNILVIINGVKEVEPINEAWYSSLVWMRENTPDPFENPDFYYEIYEKPLTGERYDYPESAYGVMNFWAHGHWITAIAHRIPTSNPFQAGAFMTSRFFITQDESSANEVLDVLGCKYVILDYELSITNFSGMVPWAGASYEEYLDIYRYRYREGGALTFGVFYYPEYYTSMSSRLYNFGGQAVVPHNSTTVISYEEKSLPLLGSYKEIIDTRNFTTYEEAKEFVESQDEPNYRIVGVDPFTSPVPLNELEHYQLVHQSDPEVLTKKKVEPISVVKIYEYVP